MAEFEQFAELCSRLAGTTKKLEKLKRPPGFTGQAPGGPSRWSTERSGEWEPLRPILVIEVRFDHVTGDRFRHGTKLLRWRPDKAPAQCTFVQIEAPVAGSKQWKSPARSPMKSLFLWKITEE